MASQLSSSPIFLSSSPKISMNSHSLLPFTAISSSLEFKQSSIPLFDTYAGINRSTRCILYPHHPMVKNGMKGLERTLAIIDWGSYSVLPAKAVLYSPDTKVPRTGELALRRAIPANSNMKTIQESLEELSFLLRIPQRKP